MLLNTSLHIIAIHVWLLPYIIQSVFFLNLQLTFLVDCVFSNHYYNYMLHFYLVNNIIMVSVSLLIN